MKKKKGKERKTKGQTKHTTRKKHDGTALREANFALQVDCHVLEGLGNRSAVVNVEPGSG